MKIDNCLEGYGKKNLPGNAQNVHNNSKQVLNGADLRITYSMKLHIDLNYLSVEWHGYDLALNK